MPPIGPALILLHPRDNILIAGRQIQSGERVEIDDGQVTMRAEILVGHKVARTALTQGDQVTRFGAPIGSMTANVDAGGHVHVHNMKSDYIATHDRQAVRIDGDPS